MKLKMLQVTEETHIEAKTQALKKGMSIKTYIDMLIKKDTSSNIEEYICNEFDLKFSDDKFKKRIQQGKNGKTFKITVEDK